MALIIETGAIVANADSWATLAEANAYAIAIGNLAWEDLDDEEVKEPALRVAAQYLNYRWRANWRGFLVRPLDDTSGNLAQRLAWPRVNAWLDEGFYFPSDQIPVEVQYAQIEYAIQASASGLLLSPTPALDSSGRLVTRQTTIVGPLEETFEYAQSSAIAVATVRPYPKADAMVARWLKPTGGSYR